MSQPAAPTKIDPISDDPLLHRPTRLSWSAFKEKPLADANWLTERADVIEERVIV